MEVHPQNSGIIVNNLFLKYTKNIPQLSLLAFRTTYGELPPEMQLMIPNAQDDDTILLSLDGSIIKQEDFYTDNTIVLKTEPFMVDVNGYQVIYILLKRHTNDQNDIGLEPLILQMDSNGIVHSLLQNPVPGKYRTITYFMFDIPNHKLKYNHHQYIEIVNEFMFKHKMEQTNKLNNRTDITVDSLLKLQNLNLKLFNIPHIDINILSHLEYNLINYLARFSPYLLKLIDTEEFYMGYITAHYGTNILNEKDDSSSRDVNKDTTFSSSIRTEKDIKREKITYKQWYNYLLRNDVIFFWGNVNELIRKGKYYLVKYIFEKHEQINNYHHHPYSIGESKNMKIVDLLGDISDDTTLISEILEGAAKTNPEWFEELLNKFNVNHNEINLGGYLYHAFLSNNLNMVKYFRNIYQIDFNIIQRNVFDLLNSLFYLNVREIKKNSLKHENENDYTSPTLDLLRYLFIETHMLDVNYFRNGSQQFINAGVNINNYTEGYGYLYDIMRLIGYIGKSGDDKLISFFLNNLNIMSNFNNKTKISLHLTLLNSIAESGNTTLFKKYFNIVKEMLTEEVIVMNNLNISNSNETNLLKLITPSSGIKSGNMEMVKHFDSLGLFDGRVYEKNRKNVMQVEGSDVVNIIVYALNAENIDIFDYLSPKLIDEEYTSQYLSPDILATESGLDINNNNIYDPLLFILYSRGMINLYDMISFSFYHPEVYIIVEIIWIFKLTPVQFINVFKNLWHSNLYLNQILDELVDINYLTEDDIKFIHKLLHTQLS